MGWVVNATPRPLYPRERPGTHCIGGWVGPRAGLDGCGKSRPHRDSNPDRPARSDWLYRLSCPGPLTKWSAWIKLVRLAYFQCTYRVLKRGSSLRKTRDWTSLVRERFSGSTLGEATFSLRYQMALVPDWRYVLPHTHTLVWLAHMISFVIPSPRTSDIWR